MKLPRWLRSAERWFYSTPERALDQAYRAALVIKSIEDEHFQGKKVSAESCQYSSRVFSYFQAEVKKYLKTARLRLNEFKATSSFFRSSEKEFDRDDMSEFEDKSTIIIEKLNFIDEVISKYDPPPKSKRQAEQPSTSLIAVPKKQPQKPSTQVIKSPSSDFDAEMNKNGKRSDRSRAEPSQVNQTQVPEEETVTDKMSVLPRSLLRTLNRIQREIDPKSAEAEEEVVQTFRRSRNKTAISIRFLLILIIVPLLVHQLSKSIIIRPLIEGPVAEIPIVERFFNQGPFINRDIEEEAFLELERFENRLRFREITGIGPELTPTEIEEQVREKAIEIVREYRDREINAFANIFADLFSVTAFGVVIYYSKKEIAVLKSFLDEVIYGLSDSAKAFLIILFTDMFVGYHSPHGWEVILESISRHFGFPESREFNFLFIATFPVILDTVMKYWIFRYLNRISPSAVATYRNMNE